MIKIFVYFKIWSYIYIKFKSVIVGWSLGFDSDYFFMRCQFES